MAGGGKVQIIGTDRQEVAQVVNGRLLVSTDGGGGGPTADVNIAQVSGVNVGGSVPIKDGGNVISVDDAGGSLTVDGTVDLGANGSVVDANNSTTTPLGIGGIFTGTGTDCLGYSSVATTLYADEDSANDGMTFQFSTDNVNWDDVYPFNMVAGETRRFQFAVTARYFRVVYTNGGTAQSAFRIQTILHTTDILTSIHRVEDNVSVDRSATLVKSVLIAQVNGVGDFIPIQANAAGVLKVGGSVDVDNFPASQTVDDGGGSLTVDGTVNIGSSVDVSGSLVGVINSIHDNLVCNANIQIGDVDVGAGNPVPVSDNGASLTVDDGGGSLTVDLSGPVSVVDGGGSGATLDVKEDNTASGGAAPDTAMVGGVVGSISYSDGDYAVLRFSADGELLVSMVGQESMSTDHLSGSTNGQPIAVTAVATPGTLLHTATSTAGTIDRIYIWLTNISDNNVTVTIEFGSTGAGNEIDLIVPAHQKILAVNGEVLGGAASQVVRAYAGTASVINATGRVETLS